MFGAMFPDADHKKAPIGRFIPLWLFFKHRGFTHSFAGLVVFSLPFMYYSVKWMCIFAAGYMLHLMLDAGTPMGVKWMFGHKRKKRVA
jgi:inner membrane protein